MGATDNAFIKAYEDARNSVGETQRVRQNRAGIHEDGDGITVDSSRTFVDAATKSGPVLSQVVAGPSMPRPQEIPLPKNIASNHKAHPAVPSESPVPRPHFDVSAFADATGATTAARTLQNATLRSAMLQQPAGPAEEVVTIRGHGTFHPANKTTAPTWVPEWEVDGFRWPSACERLYTKCADRITDVVRPLLHAAWRGRNVIGVTSFSRGEGATTAALCLARTAASFNVPTVLVDGDVHQHSIGEMLGISFNQGWNNNDIPFEEAAVASTNDQLVVMPAAEGTADIPRTLKLVQELANQFEIVIVDTGPIFTAAHHWFEQPICSLMHNAIVVQDVRTTSDDQLEDVNSRLAKSGMLDVAIIENFSSSLVP